MMLNESILREQVRRWLEEDVGAGDVTSYVTIPATLEGKAVIYGKENGIVAGLPVIKAIFSELDSDVSVVAKVEEGQALEAGDVIVELNGNIHSILKGERVALNILQRLSGIATRTNQVVLAAKQGNPNIKIVDTRKTTPGLRMVEKYAVTVGGGFSHRYGLYDAVLIKDNHIKAAGGIKEAITSARKKVPHTMTIEVEVETISQVIEALEAGPDIIMFDNMPLDDMRSAIDLIGNQAITEASGGITLENISTIAATGVNVISLGSLTYSVKALDISLDLFEKKPGR
jgi:nicotinate-nucleotide pyrophosphorylase (carboxylating)